MMLQAKALAEDLLEAIRDLTLAVRSLHQEFRKHRMTTGGEQ
jgi:hypothetical protein